MISGLVSLPPVSRAFIPVEQPPTWCSALRPMPNWAAASRMRTIHLSAARLTSFVRVFVLGIDPRRHLRLTAAIERQGSENRAGGARRGHHPRRHGLARPPVRSSGPRRADRRHRARGRGPRTGALLGQRPHRDVGWGRPDSSPWPRRRQRAEVVEYSPNQVGRSTASGADKRQVGEMVQRLLGLASVPTPADAAG